MDIFKLYWLNVRRRCKIRDTFYPEDLRRAFDESKARRKAENYATKGGYTAKWKHKRDEHKGWKSRAKEMGM